MYARVTTFQVKSDKMEHAIRAYEHTSIGANQRDRGFLRNLLLTDSIAGKAVGITLWETEADMQASQAAHESRTEQAEELDFLGGTPTTEVFEVSVDAQPYE